MFLDRREHVLTTRIDRRVDELFEFAGWKAGVVFDLGGLGQLPHRKATHDPVLFGHGTLEKQRSQVSSCGVDSGRPTSRSTTDDDAVFDVAHKGVLSDRIGNSKTFTEV